MLNTLAFLAASTVGQFFVVNPQIPVVQTQTTVVTTTVPVVRPYVYPIYGPPVVAYTTPYYYPYYPVYSVYPTYPVYRIYP